MQYPPLTNQAAADYAEALRQVEQEISDIDEITMILPDPRRALARWHIITTSAGAAERLWPSVISSSGLSATARQEPPSGPRRPAIQRANTAARQQINAHAASGVKRSGYAAGGMGAPFPEAALRAEGGAARVLQVGGLPLYPT